MARNFKELQAKMSPESRARSDAKAKEMLAEIEVSDMEENKVATDNEVRERAVGICAHMMAEYGFVADQSLEDAIFRELVAVRDQAAKYTTAEEWKRMHEEVTND